MMKRTFWKTAAAAIALSFGAPAFAACDLCALAKNSDLAGIESLLNNRPEVHDGADAQSIAINGQDNRGQTALISAASRGSQEIVALLLNDPHEPADPNLANNLGITPLIWAARKGNLPMAQLLVEHGADISATGGRQNESVLQYAMRQGNRTVAEYLVAQGASLDCDSPEQFNGTTIACEIPMQFCHDNDMVKVDGECRQCSNDTQRIENDCVPLPPCGDNEERNSDGECACAPRLRN